MNIKDLEGKTIKTIMTMFNDISIEFTDGTRVSLETIEGYGGCETCGYGGVETRIEVSEF